MHKVLVVSACRTPVGKAGGQLSIINDTDLLTLSIEEAVKRCKVQNFNIDDSYVGCCFPKETYNLGRKAILQSKFNSIIPSSIPVSTINRTCCSSMEALIQGSRAIQTGDASIVLVGGVENMSQSNQVLKNTIAFIRKQKKLKLYNETDIHMDDTSLHIEKLSKDYKITRKEQDEYAINSYRKAFTASENGYFNQEMFCVDIAYGEKKIYLNRDESLSQIPPVSDFYQEEPNLLADGTLTKLNTSPINDGSAAMVLASEAAVEKYNLPVIAEMITSATIGTEPELFGISPALAIQALIRKSQIKLNDFDLIEVNEAYASQIIACNKILNWDSNKININGGSLAIGHPLGCTGLRICISLIFAMHRLSVKQGIAAMCAGGGIGQAVFFRNNKKEYER